MIFARSAEGKFAFNADKRLQITKITKVGGKRKSQTSISFLSTAGTSKFRRICHSQTINYSRPIWFHQVSSPFVVCYFVPFPVPSVVVKLALIFVHFSNYFFVHQLIFCCQRTKHNSFHCRFCFAIKSVQNSFILFVL